MILFTVTFPSTEDYYGFTEDKPGANLMDDQRSHYHNRGGTVTAEYRINPAALAEFLKKTIALPPSAEVSID